MFLSIIRASGLVWASGMTGMTVSSAFFRQGPGSPAFEYTMRLCVLGGLCYLFVALSKLVCTRAANRAPRS